MEKEIRNKKTVSFGCSEMWFNSVKIVPIVEEYRSSATSVNNLRRRIAKLLAITVLLTVLSRPRMYRTMQQQQFDLSKRSRIRMLLSTIALMSFVEDNRRTSRLFITTNCQNTDVVSSLNAATLKDSSTIYAI